MTRNFYSATVLDRKLVTPGMVRVTFGGEGLKTFASTGIGDEYLRLFFPDPQTGELVLPTIDEKGHWHYPEGPSKVCCSTYTVRRYDAEHGQIDIDFVVHEGGTASEWSQKANPGDVVTLNSPRGLFLPPATAEWQLLVADSTGLPAVSRLLEQGPTLPTRVFIEVPNPTHQQPLPPNAKVTVTWLYGGNSAGPSQLEHVIRTVPLPSTPGYVWVATEQKVARVIRKYVRHELKVPAGHYEIVGYWTAQHDWEQRYEALDPAIKATIEAAWDSDRDPEDVQDEVEATFEKLGL